MRVCLSRLHSVLIACGVAAVFAVSIGGDAQARNVPGSAAGGLPPLVTASNDLIISDVLGEIRDMNVGGQSGQAQAGNKVRFVALDPKITSDAIDPLEIGKTGLPRYRGLSASIFNEGGFGIYTVGHYREIDAGTELQSDLFTFGAYVGYQATQDLFLTIGAVGEVSDGRTPFNQGTLDSQGIGVAAGANYRIGQDLSLSVLGGYLGLEYDTTRGLGTVSGSFDADRYFFDVSGDYTFSWDAHDTLVSAGLRYLYQEQDAYVESGGAAVPSFSLWALSGTASTKTYFGSDPELRPFAEASGRVNLIDDFDGPANVIVLEDDTFNVRFAGGFNYSTEGGTTFEVGAGVNISEDGYNGLDATVRALIPF